MGSRSKLKTGREGDCRGREESVKESNCHAYIEDS